MSEKREISEELQKVLDTPLCIPMTQKDAKRVLSFYNKMLKKNPNKKAQELGEYGEKNLDSLAKGFVKMRCQGILDNEENKNG